MKSKAIIAGLDEAGRGAVIGPMVIAGVSVTGSGLKKIKALGVRDSKELAPKRREKLAKQIEKIAKDILIVKVGPCKIDNYKKEGINLNRLEAIKFAEILNYLNPHLAYIDSPENNTQRFEKMLSKMTNVNFIAEHYADKKYPIVSAASILAKVERDKEMAKIRKKYGVRGSGYPSDTETIAWMREYLKEHK
ncbi:MAG TPA: ribonuclease HII, partial [Candidatus Aenigmarchaeota archaeon]|nr:ribonuclease HII [Candidatus Aenigmarchaeota archaeon]